MSNLTMMEPGIRSFEKILSESIEKLSDTQKQDAMRAVINDELPKSIVPGIALGIQLLVITGRKPALLDMLSK